MQITSPVFDDNQPIPSKYSYDGDNVSPPLEFDGVPAQAKSLVLICHDPDAPRSGGFTHWIVFDIPPGVTAITEGSVPDGVRLGTTDYGEAKWGGPHPPSGTHRYVFYLYALDKKLDLPGSPSRSDAELAVEGHILSEAKLTGLYSAV